MEGSATEYIRYLAEEQAGPKGPAFNVFNSDPENWTDSDVEFVLIDSNIPPSRGEVWEAYATDNPDECNCYICDRKIVRVPHEEEEYEWDVSQVLPLLSGEIWNYRVVCFECYIDYPAISCYHRSFGKGKTSAAKREAITTLYQAVKIFFSRYPSSKNFF